MNFYNIPESINYILESLNKNGFEAYLVGGCVRDMVLSKKPEDFDVCTNAKPKEIADVFKNHKTVFTGSKFGTITVVIDEFTVEITTYRIDGNYIDGRHPSSVDFSNSLFKDLSRRDFTMNAIAFNNTVIDPFHGLDDIKKRIIRCVGEPQIRFNEDALRILRAIRFSAQLSFSIDVKTSDAIKKQYRELNKVSGERKTLELLKILDCKKIGNILLEYKNIFEYLIFNKYQINENYWQSCCKAIDLCKNCGQKLAVLYYYYIKTNNEIPNEHIEKLKLPKKLKIQINDILKTIDYPLFPKDYSIKFALNKMDKNLFFDLLTVLKAIQIAEKKDITVLNKIIETANKIIKNNECFSISGLDISGEDIINAGISPGKQIGELLNLCLENVIYKKVKNEKNELIKLILKLKNNKF